LPATNIVRAYEFAQNRLITMFYLLRAGKFSLGKCADPDCLHQSVCAAPTSPLPASSRDAMTPRVINAEPRCISVV